MIFADKSFIIYIIYFISFINKNKYYYYKKNSNLSENEIQP